MSRMLQGFRAPSILFEIKMFPIHLVSLPLLCWHLGPEATHVTQCWARGSFPVPFSSWTTTRSEEEVATGGVCPGPAPPPVQPDPLCSE